MARTTIKTQQEGKEHILIFMTVPRAEGGVDVDIFLGDSDYIPVGKPSFGTDPRPEEEYHKALRIDAAARNEFIPEQSTNYEWNPDYEPEFYPDAAI
jgi:hypothetical protein